MTTTPHPEDMRARLLRFVALEPGWDGALSEPVARSTVVRACALARSLRDVVPDPFVTPATDGSLLLQWDFTDGASIEVYVSADQPAPDSAAVVIDSIVHEVTLDGDITLRGILEARAGLVSPSRPLRRS